MKMSELKTKREIVPEVRPWIGMDVGNEEFAAALYALPRPGTPDLRSMPARMFERSAQGVAGCIEWANALLAQKRPGAPTPRVCMEATGRFSIELAREILRQRPEMEPAIVNPRYVKKYGESLGQRCKADKADARVCACYGADRQPAPYRVPDPPFRQLRELVRERRAIVEERAALKNRAAAAPESRAVGRVHKQLMTHFDRHVEKLDAPSREPPGKFPNWQPT